jgi:hypothetical protein
MKWIATVVLSAVLTLPAMAATVHDESIHGDLSTDPNSPTALVFTSGLNGVIGTCGNVGSPSDIRDYITFTIPAGRKLLALNLVTYAPDNLGFASFNTGTTSYIPDATTAPLFLAGIHPSGTDMGSDILPLFVTNSVTGNSLPAPELGPGDYCFLIQQTSPITTTYHLEFFIDGAVPAAASTWGAIKSLYR